MVRLKLMSFVMTFLFVQVKMQSLGKHNFTSEWLVVMKDSLFPPLVTEMKDRLVYVSFPSDYKIKLETSRIVNKPCEVPVSLIKERKGKNIVPVYADTLGNGKIIVSLFESKKKLNQSNVWLYVIDPQNCTQQSDKFALDATMLTVRDVMTIVPYQNSFDIFVRSDVYCEPGTICNLRYSDKPMLISSTKSVMPYDDEGWDITTTKDYNPDDGYLYIVMLSKSNTTMIKHLNANLEIMQRTELNHSGSIAYWYNEDNSASMCFGLSDQEIECILLNPQMKVKTEVTLAYDNYVQYYSIFQLRNGDAIVLTILSSDVEGSDSATYVQHVGLDGEVSAPVKFQEYICENVFEMNTFEVEEGLFCASTMCQSIVNTKCIGSADERSF